MKNSDKTVLIVDDTETNIDILLELLSGYDVAVATSGKSALEIVDQENIDLILLDIMMPEMDGYEVCKRLKSKDKTKDIPVVFITAKTDEDSIEMAYDVGAIDYVTKPFKPRELSARVETQLKIKELIDSLNYIASYDSLAGIYNRRKFFELAINKFENHKEGLYAVMMDIDKFKSVNDTYGHSAGDKVIRAVTKKISELIDEDTLFGRVGGEEFALLCNYNSKEIILESVEKIRQEVEKLKVKLDDGEIVHFTISNGISEYKPNIRNLDSLLNEADKALYEAKEKGRNRVVFRS